METNLTAAIYEAQNAIEAMEKFDETQDTRRVNIKKIKQMLLDSAAYFDEAVVIIESKDGN